MSKKIFDNDLVAIIVNKVILTLKKPEYAGMWILDLSKVLMYEFHDYIQNIYGNKDVKELSSMSHRAIHFWFLLHFLSISAYFDTLW